MTMPYETWRGRRVLVTGHTGFIGGWLSLALIRAGAQVHGFALAPPTEPSLFACGRLSELLASDERGDIRDARALAAVMRGAAPDAVFHLAAQPLVRRAWAEPADTIDVNVMGTVRVLDAIRACPSVDRAVIMTTDKVYANREWVWPYREADRLGGSEPYGAGKAAAELITGAFRSSYFTAAGACRIATVRAGNVIGGGDWAADRLVPDAVRAFSAGTALVVRRPAAVRPWQHVIDVVSGLLLVGASLETAAPDDGCCWNIAPPLDEQVPVGDLVAALARHWGEGAAWRNEGDGGPEEAGLLRLDASKAKTELGWTPRVDLATSLAMTGAWYRAFYERRDMRDISCAQIEEILA
jgi:CDP-glucose 4,6-dehydratase